MKIKILLNSLTNKLPSFETQGWVISPRGLQVNSLFIRGKNLIGCAMGYGFDREGKPGVISRFNL